MEDVVLPENVVLGALKDKIRDKLKETGDYLDEELPEYITVLIGNRKSRAQVEEDLVLFLDDNAKEFAEWLEMTVLEMGRQAQAETITTEAADEPMDDLDKELAAMDEDDDGGAAEPAAGRRQRSSASATAADDESAGKSRVSVTATRAARSAITAATDRSERSGRSGPPSSIIGSRISRSSPPRRRDRSRSPPRRGRDRSRSPSHRGRDRSPPRRGLRSDNMPGQRMFGLAMRSSGSPHEHRRGGGGVGGGGLDFGAGGRSDWPGDRDHRREREPRRRSPPPAAPPPRGAGLDQDLSTRLQGRLGRAPAVHSRLQKPSDEDDEDGSEMDAGDGISPADFVDADEDAGSARASVHSRLGPKVKRKPCTFFPNCKQGVSCPFEHDMSKIRPPPQARPFKAAPAAAPPCTKFPNCPFGSQCHFSHPRVLCKFGLGCTNKTCNYTHPKKAAAAANKASKCKFFPNCTNKACPFQHPTKCKFGAACNSKDTCRFYHEEGAAADAADALKGSGKTPCRFGTKCTRKGCPFEHPEGKAAALHISERSFAVADDPEAMPVVDTAKAAAEARAEAAAEAET